MRFEILYHFSHGPVHLVETKRTDLPPGATPAEVYQWMLIEDKSVHRLNFQSMSINPQQRIFLEGAINFDRNSCRGNLLGKTQELTRQDTASETLLKLIREALSHR